MKKISLNQTIINITHSRIHTFIFLLSLVLLFAFSSNINSYADEIQNKASVSYKNNSNKLFNNDSNLVVTTLISIGENALDVKLTAIINTVEGKKKGNWVFPLVVRNIGRDPDSYDLSIQDLPIGISYKIYNDLNENGKVDPEDSIITYTPVLASGEPLRIIAVLTDDLGIIDIPSVKVKALAVSRTDSVVNSFDYLYVKFKTFYDPGDTSDPKVTPTPTPSNNCPSGFVVKGATCVADGKQIRAELRKRVYPAGKVKSGDILTYYIELENKGTASINNGQIIDPLPKSVEIINKPDSLPVADLDGVVEYSNDGSVWSSTANDKSRVIKANWNEIPSGVTVSIFFKVKVLPEIKDAEIVNIASAKLEADDKLKEIIIQPIRSNETVNPIKNDYAIIGTVIDKETGLPKENAIVDVYDKDGNKVGTEITGKTGKFRIPVDGAGTYKVVYSDEKGTVITERQATVTVPGDNPAPIEISGKVLNSQTNDPISNAQLSLIDGEGNVVASIKTDENGKYTFGFNSLGKPLAEGKYTVRVTKANGQTSYAKANVSVAPGDIILNLDLLIDPFGYVYDLLGGKDIRIKGAEVRFISNCSDINSLVSLDDLEKGVPQKNPQITEENGNYQYFLNESQRTNKTYCLKVTADSYEDRLLLVRVYPSQKIVGRFEITVMDEKGKKVIISNIESIPYEIGMKPLKVLDLKKSVNKSTIDLGDIATYTVEVANKLKFALSDVKLEDTLPFGFKYVPGTLRLNGKTVQNFEAVNKLNIKIGNLAPQEKVVLTYQTRSGIRVAEGASINTVVATAKAPSGEPIPPQEATATVFVKKGVFSKNGTIIGKVYIDSNDNGIQDEQDTSIENIAIYTSNGVRIVTDPKGKFSVPDIQNGQLVLKVDTNSLPKGVYLPVQAVKLYKELQDNLNKIEDKNIKLDDLNKKVFVVVKDREITISNSSENNILIETKDKSLVEVKSSTLKVASLDNTIVSNLKVISVNDLKLDKGLNELNVSFVDKNNKVVKKRKAYFFLIENPAKIKFPRWIGDEGESNIVYIPESGLAKSNFRLVKADLELPQIPALPKQKDSNMKAVYVYPDKFAVKYIPYITYPDIKSHWSRDIVEYESGLEIIHGYPDGLFKPARNITRAETTKLTLVALKSFDIKLGTTLGVILENDSKITARILDSNKNEVIKFFENKDKEAGVNKIFWNGKDSNDKFVAKGTYTFEVVSNSEDDETVLSTQIEVLDSIPNYRPKGRSKFLDVPAWHWSDSFIKAGVDESLISGYPDGTFRPDSTIPRYEIAAIGVKALGIDLGLAKDELPFKDAEEIPTWARKYVYLAYTYGLLPKFPDNKFYPNRPISRSEIALFVLELINKQKVDAKIRGSVTEGIEKLVIDGNIVVKTENNAFELLLNKAISQDINLGFEESQILKSYFDPLYLPKEIKRANTKF
jgi:uncharacterized repeat protein (TIGR01451 family)